MKDTLDTRVPAPQGAPLKTTHKPLLESIRASLQEPTDRMTDAGYRKMVELRDNSPFDGAPLLGHADKVLYAMLEKAPYSWWKPVLRGAQAELVRENTRLKAYVADMEDTLRQVADGLGLKGPDANADAVLTAVKRLEKTP